MNNLIFSLNATLPVFLLMIFGYLMNRIGFIDDKAASWMNKFVFKISLPMLLFVDLADQDFKGTWNGKFVLFCFMATIISIVVIFGFSFLCVKEKGKRGEFIQGAYRSSAALLGLAFIHNIYGDASTGMGPLMILGSVPLYNICAVIILMFTAENEGESDNKNEMIKKTAIGIAKNPIIIGIIIGLLWSLFRIPKPAILSTFTENIARLATPLGLMSMGASFEIKKALKEIKPALIATFIKLFVLVGIFLPIAVSMGFIGEQIVAILIMLGSATTVSCYIMAKSMGHEGVLSSSIIMMTTLGCSFSLTFWLFVLRSIGII
ncbi:MULTISPECIES: AEC family transporter [Butyrivibrio]|uniref:AEC family transporter n=1 Tax=Butyrivibrio TaxID=830 RepID=UPI000409E2BF|nr:MULTISPECIES: AEC family transporter [Butyrivibrio]